MEGLQHEVKEKCDSLAKEERAVQAAEKAAKDAAAFYQYTRTNALRESDNKEIEVTKTMRELMEENKEMKRMKEKRRSEVKMSLSELQSKFKELTEKIDELKAVTKSNKLSLEKAEDMEKERRRVYAIIRNFCTTSVQRSFCEYLNDHRLNGKLNVDHKTFKASLDVGSGPLTNLSGGERSKTLVCLFLALWHVQQPPFR